ncbi:MAG: hypothetical protein LBM93_08430 [Oscillospiraceae bacterium]|jgi:hypothetical protein|nr:hypothetical protein [Oscillospiraceae bacterium]
MSSIILDVVAVVVVIGSIVSRVGAVKAPRPKDLFLGILTGAVIVFLMGLAFFGIVKANGNSGDFFNYKNVKESYVFRAVWVYGDPGNKGIAGAIEEGNENIHGDIEEDWDAIDAERMNSPQANTTK